ncbi:MAG: 16S rRNA (guanine(527)-N(7))-methyltransferase RsmG [Candidatus Omnitrophota bacterium]
MEKKVFFQEFLLAVERRFISLPPEVLYSICDYFFILQNENAHTNLTAYQTIDDFIDFHFFDSRILLDCMNPISNAFIIDIGSGAGIPGIILHLLRPDLHVTLIESSQKKTRFLQKVIETLNINSCNIVNRRAEDAAHDSKWREKFDIATARAFGPLSLTLELTTSFVRPCGRIYLPRVAEEPKNTVDTQSLGCNLLDKFLYVLPRRDKTFSIDIFEKKKSTPSKFPRKVSQIKKNPL